MRSFYQEFCSHPSLDLTRYKSNTLNPYTESSFFHTLNYSQKQQLNHLQGAIIAAVDGGLGIREFQGLDLTLIKAVVVEYDFKNPFHPQISYFPTKESDANFALYTDYGINRSKNVSSLASFRRILAENSMVLDYITHKKELELRNRAIPMIIVLDGSIHLPPIQHFYNLLQSFPKLCLEVIESYRILYQTCAQNGIWLVGSVKDSRTSQLRDLLIKSIPKLLKQLNLKDNSSFLQFNYRQQLLGLSDYELLYRIMKPHSRTVIIQETRDFKINPPSLSTLPLYGENTMFGDQTLILTSLFQTRIQYSVFYSYLRLSQKDLPLRFELYCPSSINPEIGQKQFVKIIEILSPISSIEPTCTLPLPQIEAHLRAHLSEKEVDLILNPLISRLNLPFSSLVSENFPKNPSPAESANLAENTIKSRVKNTSDSSNIQDNTQLSSQPSFISSRHTRLDLLF